MKRLAIAVCAAALLAGCGGPAPMETAQPEQAPAIAALPPANPLNNAYFGDLHLHTRNSFDAYIFNVRASHEEAYAYAKGGTIKHAAGFDMKLNSGPLDFLAITDHSEYLGVLPAINTEGDPYSKVPYAKDLFSTDGGKVTAAFRKFADTLDEGKRMPDFADLRTVKSAWQPLLSDDSPATRQRREVNKIKTRAVAVRMEKDFNLFAWHFGIHRLQTGEGEDGVIEVGASVAVESRAFR